MVVKVGKEKGDKTQKADKALNSALWKVVQLYVDHAC